MHIIISCSNPYIFIIRERCLKYGSWTHFGRAKRSHHDAHIHLHTSPNQSPYQVSTFYTLWNPRNSPDKILKLMVTITRSKVKLRSQSDVAYLQPITNFPTKYQRHTPYGFQDIARTRFYRSRSLLQGERSTQGHTMTLHTYTPNQCPYQVTTSYTLQFQRYSPHNIL